MLLRNYYNWLANLTMGVGGTSASSFADGYLNTKSYNGTIHASDSGAPSYGLGTGWATETTITSAASSNRNSIILGSGDTAVTFDDYKLDSIISTGWTKGTVTVGTPAYNSGTKKWTNTISFICTNTSGSTMTIKEAGIVAYIYAYSASDSSLIYREVLAEPATITNGQSKTITLNLEYTMPTV